MNATPISRISIDVTQQQHKRLKATAALAGKSLKQYMLEKALPSESEDAALCELEAFLEPRIASAKRGDFVDQSVEEIFSEID